MPNKKGVDVTVTVPAIVVMLPFICVALVILYIGYRDAQIRDMLAKISEKTGVKYDFPYKVMEIDAEVTAYTPWDEPNPWLDGRTATGKDAEFPGCATCWEVIPKGSIVIVPKAGAFIVDDTGGACRKAWRERRRVLIDIRLQNRQKALEWGRKYLTIRVLIPCKGGE